jgi:hypothetical protein
MDRDRDKVRSLFPSGNEKERKVGKAGVEKENKSREKGTGGKGK